MFSHTRLHSFQTNEKGCFSDSVLWKTRSGARNNWSVRVHKAFFHLFQFGIVRDIVRLFIALELDISNRVINNTQ